MSPADVSVYINLFLGGAAVITVVVGFLRWANRKLEARIVEEIKQATLEIQPGANGRSLNELHNKVDRLMTEMTVLKSAVLTLEEEVEAMQ